MSEKFQEYENARIIFQDAVMYWLRRGADISEMYAEIQSTHDWYHDEMESAE